MNRKVLTAYGILQKYDLTKQMGDEYEWARRTTVVVDKEGRIQHIEFDASAVNPNNAVDVCLKLHEKATP
jgi:peroxiredoxin